MISFDPIRPNREPTSGSHRAWRCWLLRELGISVRMGRPRDPDSIARQKLARKDVLAARHKQNRAVTVRRFRSPHRIANKRYNLGVLEVGKRVTIPLDTHPRASRRIHEAAYQEGRRRQRKFTVRNAAGIAVVTRIA